MKMGKNMNGLIDVYNTVRHKNKKQIHAILKHMGGTEAHKITLKDCLCELYDATADNNRDLLSANKKLFESVEEYAYPIVDDKGGLLDHIRPSDLKNNIILLGNKLAEMVDLISNNSDMLADIDNILESIDSYK